MFTPMNARMMPAIRVSRELSSRCPSISMHLRSGTLPGRGAPNTPEEVTDLAV